VDAALPSLAEELPATSAQPLNLVGRARPSRGRRAQPLAWRRHLIVGLLKITAAAPITVGGPGLAGGRGSGPPSAGDRPPIRQPTPNESRFESAGRPFLRDRPNPRPWSSHPPRATAKGAVSQREAAPPRGRSDRLAPRHQAWHGGLRGGRDLPRGPLARCIRRGHSSPHRPRRTLERWLLLSGPPASPRAAPCRQSGRPVLGGGGACYATTSTAATRGGPTDATGRDRRSAASRRTACTCRDGQEARCGAARSGCTCRSGPAS
jgi:hypothetical protein